MFSPQISIIIPSFNSAKNIDNCLKSILRQTFQNFEIIIQDNISTDNTVDIIKEISKTNDRIKIFIEKDRGVYDAMNKGIKIAKGEWLYFLGSDDYLHDEKVLEDIVATLQKEELDVLYGEVFLTGRQIKYGGEFDLLRLHRIQNMCHQSLFYHRSVFERLGNYNLKYKINADWDLNIRCFRHPQFRIKHIDRMIAYFNDLDGISGRDHDKNLYAELSLIDMEEPKEHRIRKIIRNLFYTVGVIPLIKKILKAKVKN